MILLVVTLAAGIAAVVLAVLLALVSMAIRAEDHRPRSILGPPPGPFAAAARHIAGLHVRHAAPGSGHREPAATSSARHDEGR